MSKARLVITAIEVGGRTPAEVCAAYGVSRSWFYELLARYRAEGDTALQPPSRSAPSTPPPANCAASSPSTPAATTSPPADHPAPPAHDERLDPRSVGSSVRDVLRHHMARPAGIEPATKCLEGTCSIR